MRPACQWIVKNVPGPYICAEIGVEEGVNCERILAEMPVKHLYLIDNYKDHPDQLLITMKKIWQYRDKFTILVQDSMKIEQLLSRKVTLDFVYIDAGHDYKSVKKDLEAWYPRVRKGGVICGHDYNRVHPFDYTEEVVKAVNEFVKKEALILQTANNNAMGLLGGESDWWCVKPVETNQKEWPEHYWWEG